MVDLLSGFAGQTLVLRATSQVVLKKTTLISPDFDPPFDIANCSIISEIVTIPANGPAKLFTQSIHIPAAP